MDPEAQRLNELTERMIGAAIDVHRRLGPGLLESAYEACLSYALVTRGISIERLKSLPLEYEGVRLDCAYRMDLVVDGAVIVEVKSVEVRSRARRADDFVPKDLRREGGTDRELQRKEPDARRASKEGQCVSGVTNQLRVLSGLCG